MSKGGKSNFYTQHVHFQLKVGSCPNDDNSVQTFENCTGRRPVLAAYQWWPFAFCTCNYAFTAP